MTVAEENARITITGDAAYDVVVGRDVLANVPDMLGPAVAQVLLVYPQPLPAGAQRVEQVLTDAGYAVTSVPVPDAESAKRVDVAAQLWAVMGRAAFTRTDAVVTFGGGTVTDLGGWVAATWLRGVAVVHVPTTLLAMVDAAVGGKTGINTAEGKNLVGSFHPPAGVVCDLEWLTTLPDADLRAGLAEVVKAGFIADPEILRIVETDPAAALDPRSPQLAELIERAIAVKARVVSADLRESSLREILNYGHTFGHAIELVEDYSWRHGDAVAVGMMYAAQLGFRAGHTSAELLERHERVLTSLGLPTHFASAEDRFEDLLAAMRRDKKSRADTLRFVVLDGVGEPVRLVGPRPEWLRECYVAVRGGSSSARGT